MKRPQIVCLVGFCCMAATSRAPVAAQVLVDDFSSIAVNSSLWSVNKLARGPMYGQGGGQVAMFLPAYSNGDQFGVFYNSRLRLRGDFDMQVEFSLPLWPPRNGVRVGLITAEIGNVERDSWGRNDAGAAGDRYATNFRSSGLSYTSASDLTGKLRLVRAGKRIMGYRWDNASGQWVLLRSAAAPTTDTQFSIGIWSHDPVFADQNVLVTFSNFIINQGTLVYPNGQPF
jgi:hypothetical protein